MSIISRERSHPMRPLRPTMSVIAAMPHVLRSARTTTCGVDTGQTVAYGREESDRSTP